MIGVRPEQRVVTQLPLDELWTDRGALRATRVCELSAAEIADLLRWGPIRFVVANGGLPLDWIPVEQRYEFWKSQVKMRLVDPAAERFRLEDFPGEYCYAASEWKADEVAEPIVLLSTFH
jgi:hypothetical protein